MRPDEMPWELDQRMKCGICEANMNLTDSQHRNWLIIALLSYLSITLSQKKIGTQAEALKIVMRLHETPIQDASLEIQQIHAELQNFYLELQSLKKEKVARLEVHGEVWCLKCKN